MDLPLMTKKLQISNNKSKKNSTDANKNGTLYQRLMELFQTYNAVLNCNYRLLLDICMIAAFQIGVYSRISGGVWCSSFCMWLTKEFILSLTMLSKPQFCLIFWIDLLSLSHRLVEMTRCRCCLALDTLSASQA